jgi:hypothetical protein
VWNVQTGLRPESNCVVSNLNSDLGFSAEKRMENFMHRRYYTDVQQKRASRTGPSRRGKA